jgi:hypothetical protein
MKICIGSFCRVFKLAITTAALTVPIHLFRKQRAAFLAKSLLETSVPPRRSGAAPQQLLPVKPQPSLPDPARIVEAVTTPKGFSPRLYAVKALGIATLLVITGSVTAVWSVRSFLGVHNVCVHCDHLCCCIDLLLDSRICRPGASNYSHEDAGIVITNTPPNRFDRGRSFTDG